jgi:hypothetical protein
MGEPAEAQEVHASTCLLLLHMEASPLVALALLHNKCNKIRPIFTAPGIPDLKQRLLFLASAKNCCHKTSELALNISTTVLQEESPFVYW